MTAYVESQTQAIWGKPEKPNLLDYSHRDRTLEAVGSRNEFNLAKPNAREDCSWRNSSNAPHGGILDQLIADCRGQLAKTGESIVWHNSQYQDIQKRLQRLEELKTLEPEKDS